MLGEETFYPVLGSWLGRTVGADIAAIDGIPLDVPEDWLKSLAAASASTGQVGLFHVIGVTPEAGTADEAFNGEAPRHIITPTVADMRTARDSLSTADDDHIDCVALGSPHFSFEECQALARLCENRRFSKPLYVCTRHDVFSSLEQSGDRARIETAGGIFVLGTCVVVTPILKQASGTLMTNSGKFAHYGPSTVNHAVVYGSLADCVNSAVSGRVERDEAIWQ